MKEILFTHHDLEENQTTKALAVFSKDWSDALICNAVRHGLVARGDIELDELDIDDDGIVECNGNIFTITWTHSRGAKSVTVLEF